MKPGARTSGTEHRQSPPPAAIRILVLEDNPADLELIRRALRDAKLGLFRVTAAGRLRQALDLLARAPFEAILADLHLPDSDGFETILQLRAHYPNVPLLVLTGVDDESIGVAAMQQGAQDFIFKGALGGQSLARSIRYAMERHRLETSLREANEGLEQAVQARTLALQEREAGLRRAQLMASLAHVITGPDGAFESWSESLPKLIGVEPAHVPASTREWLELVHPEDRADFRAAAVEADRTGTRLECEYRLRRADGAWMHIRQVSEPLDGTPDGSGELRWFGTLQDVTERKAAETRIRRLNRVYAVLSGINTLIVRVRDRSELFQEACQIALQAGQFVMAWIGVVERDTRRIRPVASAGADPEYMSFIRENFSLSEDAPLGDTLVARAVREKKTHFSNDAQNDPRVRFQKEHAKRGSRSIAVLPLLVADQAVGVLVLYTAETGFFDEEELKLLSELAGDISFAMQHLEALGKVEYLAFHDPLTGLPNRTVLIDRLAQMLSAARRGNQLAGVMFFDVERFRLINDTLGRAAGDQFLKQVAERFKAAIRAQDTVVRVGADVFAVAVSGITNVADAMHFFVDRLTRAFTPPILVGGRELRAVLKAGIALFPNDGDTAEILCRNAEAALNKAEEAGDRYVFYTPALNARVAESLALENRLRGALETGQFVLHYQPKVDTKTRALVGLEALIRWNDPELGLVPPGKFIPLMEETGIILQAGRWALKRAVTDIQSWRAKGFAAPRVAVNVSPVQLRQPDFVKTVLGALKGFGEDEPALDLEITESMVMQNLDATVQALQALRGAGVETSLDDFGTGYSSLAYVSRLPVVALKIDRSFVVEMTFSRYARTIVQTVVTLAHSLGLKVIAEGVDAEEQAAMLVELGCDQMQGYLISRPVPPEQIEAMLQKA
jgi:diguanylate cyclase (GGDEF)-like protein/PAS domain S-box-containing protein